MKCINNGIKPSTIVEVTSNRKALEVGFEAKINLPITKVLEYKQISISTGVFQYLVDFLNGQNQKNANLINLLFPQSRLGKMLYYGNYESNHRIEMDIDRYENIYGGDFIEINGDSHIQIGIYLHLVKHVIESADPSHTGHGFYNESKTINFSKGDEIVRVGEIYKYTFSNLKFEIAGQMRFKKISNHEAKVVLIKPEKIRWEFDGGALDHKFSDKMNDPFVNKFKF